MHDRIGLGFVAGAAVLYGSAYPATAVALRSFSPIGVAAIACTLALPVVAALAWTGILPRPHEGATTRDGLARLIVLSLLGGAGFIAAANVAVDLSGPTIAGFVTPLYAVAAALLAVPILGERMRPVTLVAFALAIAGTALLAGFDPRGVAWSGIVVAIIAALAFGLYIVLARRWGRPYGLDGTIVTMANLASRGPLLLAVEAVRAPAGLLPSEPDPSALVAILAIAFGASSTANLLLIAGVRRVPAGRASAALLLAPLSSAAIGVLLLGERLTPVEIAGAALILAGIAGASGLFDRAGRATLPAET
jgi:drug/metabolite transporter (DMT)-like permease